MIRLNLTFFSIVFLTTVTGCTNYYVVKDLNTGGAYYGTDIEVQSNGAVRIRDEKTGVTVTVMNPDVTKLDRGGYKAALSSRPKPVIKQLRTVTDE